MKCAKCLKQLSNINTYPVKITSVNDFQKYFIQLYCINCIPTHNFISKRGDR